MSRRWGSKISKRGHHRDSALSSKEHSVSSPGLPWIVMAVVVTVPWTKQRWALPFFCVLATTPEGSLRQGKRHKTIGMWAHQMISLVRRWLPDRRIRLMGDTGRLDAVLHEPPPERTQHTMGRPRVVGQRLPALEQVLQNPATLWQKLTLDWYGQGERTLEMCTGSALWYRSGYSPLPIRWVLTRDPLGKRPPKAIFCTDPALPAEEIIKDEILRWSLEVTFEEGRALMAHRDATPMVGSHYRALDASALWPLQPGDSLWTSVAPRWAGSCRACRPGIASASPRSVMCSLSSGAICGAS